MIPETSLLVMLVRLVDHIPTPPMPAKRNRGRPSFYPDLSVPQKSSQNEARFKVIQSSHESQQSERSQALHAAVQSSARPANEMLREEKSVAQLAAEHGIHPNQLYQWRDQALQALPLPLPSLFSDQSAREQAAKDAAHER